MRRDRLSIRVRYSAITPTEARLMASLRRTPRSPFWIACFTLPNGRRTNRSTGTTDKKHAQRIANKFEDISNDAGSSRLTEIRARRTIADIFAIANQRSLLSSTIRAFLENWLKRKEREVSETTHAKYKGVIRTFLRFLGEKADKELVHMSSQDIADFRDQTSQRVALGTANLDLKIIRSALEQAKRDGLIDVNEASRVSLLKRRKATFQRRQFTREEIRQILAVAEGDWRGMILIGLYTGQRLGDLASLRWSDVDLVSKEVALSTEKTGRRQVIPMHEPLVKYLTSLPAGDDPDAPLFPEIHATHSRNKHAGALSNQFYDILVKAGLAEKRTHKATKKGRSAKREQNAVSFHSLRHTATSWLKNAGVSDSVAQDIIGHDSKAVSAHYTKIDMRAKRDAVRRLPDVLSEANS